MEALVDTRPDALYCAIIDDVSAFLPLGPVAPSKLPPDASYKQFVSASLVHDVIRKWIPSDSSDADRAAKEKFLASNKKCRDWSLQFHDEGDRLLWGEFVSQLYSFFHFHDSEPIFHSYDQILDHGRVGPGSAIGANGNSMYAKLFSSKLTVTSPMLYEMYSSYLSKFHLWSEADCYRRDHFGDFVVVDSSRCSFVPKTRDVSRMICVEPSVNMFYQLGLGALFEDRLRRLFHIDFDSQPSKNRLLARLGSKDGSFSTIDLSSASDSLSLRMLQECLPKWVFQTLLELRSRKTTIDGEDVPLFMISTMGNGFTFPLQTIIFSCLIRAAYSVAGFPAVNSSSDYNWCCFGDDLVVKTSVFPYVARLLRLIGCEMNSSKTFFEGPFRESCGADWFYGQPARSVFVKQLRSQQDIFVAINLLNRWSAYTGIALRRAIQFLVSCLRARNREIVVPFDENVDSGICVPSAYIENMPKRDRNGSIIYRVYRARPKHIHFVGDMIRVPRRSKKLIYNPSGLYLSFLRGELSDGKIAIRHDRVFYYQKLRCTPYWDHMPRDTLFNGSSVSWQQWETAVLINLSNP